MTHDRSFETGRLKPPSGVSWASHSCRLALSYGSRPPASKRHSATGSSGVQTGQAPSPFWSPASPAGHRGDTTTGTAGRKAKGPGVRRLWDNPTLCFSFLVPLPSPSNDSGFKSVLTPWGDRSNGPPNSILQN